MDSFEVLVHLLARALVAFKRWSHEIVLSAVDENNVFSTFKKDTTIELQTDPDTLCRKKKAIFKLNCPPGFLSKMKVRNLICYRKVKYYDFYSLSETTRSLEERMKLRKKIQLSNEFEIPTKIAEVTSNFYGEGRSEDNSVLLVHLGTNKYKIYRDPPEIDLETSSPRSNIHDLRLEFVLKEPRDINYVEIKTGFPRKKITKLSINEKNKPAQIGTFQGISLQDLKNGLNVKAKFKFLFNVADENIWTNIKFHYYCDLKREYVIFGEDPALTLKSNPHFDIRITPIACKPKLDFTVEKRKSFVKYNEAAISLCIPKNLLKKFDQEGNDRISSGKIQFGVDDIEADVKTTIFSYRVEKIDPVPTIEGGYWTNIAVIGPKDREPPRKIILIAKEVFLKYLDSEKLRLKRKGFQPWKISEIAGCFKAGTSPIKLRSEREMHRYGASSKTRLLADIILVESDFGGKIQFLVKDVQRII